MKSASPLTLVTVVDDGLGESTVSAIRMQGRVFSEVDAARVGVHKILDLIGARSPLPRRRCGESEDPRSGFFDRLVFSWPKRNQLRINLTGVLVIDGDPR